MSDTNSEGAVNANLSEAAFGLESTFSKILRVLVAEDTESQRLLLVKQVEALGFEVAAAGDGEQAARKLTSFRPHIVLTDWIMPGRDGIEICRMARASPRGDLIYLIMLTAHGDDDQMVEAFDAGADDYLSKPLSVRELHARLRAARRIVALQTDLRLNAANLRALNAELSTANRRLFDMAHLDVLTELPNRRLMVERLQQAWAAYARHRRPLAMILLDIDHFKRVNDEHGHDMGDRVLKRVAQILREEMRTEDTVARFGGEEFLILAPDVDRAAAMGLAERIRAAIAREPFACAGHSWTVTASFGVAGASAALRNWEGLFKQADLALYKAKQAGRNRVEA